MTERKVWNRARPARATAQALAVPLAVAGLAGAATPSAHAAETATLILSIVGVEHAEGVVQAEVYRGPEGYRDPERAVARVGAAAEPGTVVIAVQGLTPGPHAVIVYHDEDHDGTMDRFLGMMPTEGYGVSNNPSLSGPPGFDESTVAIGAGEQRIVIEMRY